MPFKSSSKYHPKSLRFLASVRTHCTTPTLCHVQTQECLAPDRVSTYCKRVEAQSKKELCPSPPFLLNRWKNPIQSKSNCLQWSKAAVMEWSSQAFLEDKWHEKKRMCSDRLIQWQTWQRKAAINFIVVIYPLKVCVCVFVYCNAEVIKADC